MTNINYSLNSLSKNEIKLLLESLLFSSCVDVNASWYREDSLKAFELAKKIRSYFPEVITENVYIYDFSDKQFNDEHAKDILESFPETKKTKEDL